MTKFISLATLLWFVALCGPLHAQVTVTVHKTDHTTASVSVDASGEIYFTTSRLTIMESTLTGATTAFALDEVSKLTFDGDVSHAFRPEAGAALSLYPNPTTGVVTLSGIGTAPADVRVYSVAGSLLMEQRCADGGILDVSRLRPGLYFVRVGQQVLKLSKQ